MGTRTDGLRMATILTCRRLLVGCVIAASCWSPSEAAWRHLPSPDPHWGADFEALMQTADVTRSDVGMVGMMARCDGGHIEAVFVILDALPPRTSVEVGLKVLGRSSSYKGSLIPTGAGVVVPLDLPAEMAGPWQTARELEVTITAGAGPVHGTFDLAGLGAPLQTLDAACRAQPSQLK